VRVNSEGGHAKMANDAGQWRAVHNARYETETQSAHPLHQPGWAEVAGAYSKSRGISFVPFSPNR
jgi:hypothetical protein